MQRTVGRWCGTYGFVTAEEGKRYFFHFSGIAGEGFRELEAGQRVSFDPGESERGTMAVNVRVIGEAEECA